MLRARKLFTSKQAIWVLIFFVFISACSTQENPTATPIEFQQLRITNSGNEDIVNLVVIFPGATWDSEASRVEFGNVTAGQTTKYQALPNGVYRYAAYEYTLSGQVVSQFVTDWVGETPISDKKFTYEIMLDPEKVKGNQIILITVLVDKP